MSDHQHGYCTEPTSQEKNIAGKHFGIEVMASWEVISEKMVCTCKQSRLHCVSAVTTT